MPKTSYSNILITVTNFAKRFNTILAILLTLFIAIFFNDIISINIKKLLYTLSYILKNLLMFFLPLLIFPIITCNIISMITMKAKGAYLIPIILLIVLISNIISLNIPYLFGIYLIPNISRLESAKTIQNKEIIESLYEFNLPELVSISQIMIAGIVVGFVIVYSHSSFANKIISRYYNISYSFFEKIFIPIMPVCILGVMLKTIHAVDFNSFLPIFGNMIFVTIFLQTTYIFILFLIGCDLNLSHAILCIKNTIPAWVVGFSTMSSLVTMPITLKAAERNINNNEIAQTTITTTVNCHDIGECISLSMITLTLFYINFHHLPEFSTYLLFTISVALAQFSGASVPGGSIAIMLPFLISHLKFTDEMISLILTLSICLDPIGTAYNVTGNSAFVILINKFFAKQKHISRSSN